MRALKPVLAVLCVFSLAFAGQTGKISGRVTEAGTGNPLIGTNVIVDGTSFGAATDENGEYFIINLPPGMYSVTFSMIGYAEYNATAVSVSMDVTTPLEASLERRVASCPVPCLSLTLTIPLLGRIARMLSLRLKSARE